MSKYGWRILGVVVMMVLWGWSGSSRVSAAECGGIHGDCTGGWTCVAGQCLQDNQCWVNVCNAPNICQGDICIPVSGGGNNCPCGLNTAGTGCKNCNPQCGNPSAFGINCPPGTVRGTTQVSSVCARPTHCPGLGNAQLNGPCCNWTYYEDDCRMVEAPNQPSGWREVCYEVPPDCNYNYIITYTCAPICNSTAPTGLSVTQGASATVAIITWTPGTNGTHQLLRVDEDLSEVNNGCPTPNDCEVKTGNLTMSTNSYPVTGLLPNMTYYVP